MDCFSSLGSVITDDARCTRETKFRVAMAKAAFDKKKNLFVENLDSNLREKLVKGCNWSLAWYGAESCSIRTEGRTDMTKHVVVIGMCLANHSKNRRTPL